MKIGGEPAAERLVYFLVNYGASLVLDPFNPDYNPEAVELGKRMLEKVKTILLAIGEASLKPVINSLAYSSPQVRQISREVLGKIGKPAQYELMRALIHSDRFMRLAAAEELEEMGWKPKNDAIGAAYWFARQEWETGIKMGWAAVDPLIALFRDRDETIRRKAVECLDRIGWQPAQDTVGADYWIIKRNWQECARIGAPAVPSLTAFFADMVNLSIQEPNRPQYRQDRDGAAQALILIGEPVIEPLLTVLKDNPETASEPVIEIFSQIGKPASAPLLSALRSRQPSIRRLAARALGKIAIAEAVEPLIRALDDMDDEVCRQAVIALGNIGSRQALEPLILRLNDLKEDIRREAAVALGKIGDHRAQLPLIKTLQDISADVKIAAANALGQVGDDHAVAPLINTLRREGEEVQKAAAEALLAIGGPLVIEMLIDLLTGITDSTNWNPDSRTYDLKATLSAGYIQIKTKWVLAELAPDSIEPLIGALKGRSGQVRFHLHQALGMIGEAAVAALRRRLEDPEMEWRELAADALDAIGWQPGSDRNAAAYWAVRREWKKCAAIGEPAVPVLIHYLTQYDAWERMAAAEALQKIGWQPVTDAEAAVYWIALQEWHKVSNLRQAAVTPLINSLNDYTRQITIGTIDRDEGMGVIEMIRKTLVQIGEPAVVPLLEDFRRCSPETRPHISAALVEIGEVVLEPLADIVGKENAVIRAEAVEIAGSIQSEKALPLLQRALQDTAFIVREKAVEGLEKTGKILRDNKLRVELIEMLVDSLKDPHSRVRSAAQHALKNLDWQGK